MRRISFNPELYPYIEKGQKKTHIESFCNEPVAAYIYKFTNTANYCYS